MKMLIISCSLIFGLGLLIVGSLYAPTCTEKSFHGPRIGDMMLIAGCP